VAGGGAATAVAVTLAVMGPGEQSAFAGWSASPTPPGSGQVQTAASVCQARLNQALVDKQGFGSPAVPVLTDTRGPYTVIVFGNGGKTIAFCLAAPGGTSIRLTVGEATLPGSALAPDGVAVDRLSFAVRDGQAYTLAGGRVDSDVTAVTVVLDDGSQVVTTTGGGLFVAWWPGQQGIRSTLATTTAGTQSEPLNLPGPQLRPPPSAKGS
jgi:hypothetical protein